MKTQMPTIVSISGPSGAGKTTLLNSLLKEIPDSRPLQRVTTRTSREDDDPREYVYVTPEEFQRMEKVGELINPVTRNGFRHGIPLGSVTQREGLILADLSPESVKLLADYLDREFPRIFRMRSIFLAFCPENVLRQRMLQRGETNIDARIREARNWEVDAQQSGIAFMFLDARASTEEVLADACRIIDL